MSRFFSKSALYCSVFVDPIVCPIALSAIKQVKIKKWMVDWERVGEYVKAVFSGQTVKDHMTSNYISALNKWNP
jgi:hypothetical protein